MQSIVSKHGTKIIYFLLVLIPLLVYNHNRDFDFVWDDTDIYLNKDNYPEKTSFSDYLKFWDPSSDKMYIPVTYTFWTIAGLISGSDNTPSQQFNPAIFHLFNIIFHILNGLLVFSIIRLIIKNKWFAFSGALLFLMHPVQAEAVSWVSELRGLLAAFFGFLSVLMYMKSLENKEKQDIKLYFIAILMFILSMLSKPSAVVFPLIILILDYFHYKRGVKEILKSSILFFILIIPVMIRAKLAESNLPEGFETELWTRPFIFFDSLSFYLFKVVLPIDLVADYARKPAAIMDKAWFYLSWLVPAAIAAILWLKRKTSGYFTMPFLIFVSGFLALSGLVTFYFQDWSTTADRYIYVSMLGVGLAFSFLISKIRNNNAAVFLVVVSGLLFSIMSFIQSMNWEDELMLWDNVIEKNPDVSAHAYNGRGYYFLEKGDFYKAMNDFNKALEIHPNYARVLYNRGNIFLDTENYPQAIQDFTRAIDLKINNPNAYYNRGMALSYIGKLNEAIADYTKALSFNEKQPDIYVNRGIAYAQLADWDNAISDFQSALLYNPQDENARYNLKMAVEEKRKTGK